MTFCLLDNEEYKLENNLAFFMDDRLFSLFSSCLKQVYINLFSDMPSELLVVHFFLVRLNMVSGLNPHMNVNRGIASPNPFGRGWGVSGRSLVFLLNEPSITELNFALKSPIYRVAKVLERWEGREGMVCVLSVGYRSTPKLLGSTE